MLSERDEELNLNLCCKNGEYEVIRMIGRGAFSKVYEGRALGSGLSVALKFINKITDVGYCPKDIFDAELKALASIGDHVNILKLIDAFETLDHWVMVSEYCSGGDLYNKIEGGLLQMTEGECRSILKQVISGLEHMHRHFVCHRDLKLENILFTDSGKVVIADLGLARSYYSLRLTRCGSEEYAAPEIVLGEAYDPEKVDVWSFGVVMYACLKGKLPFLRTKDIRVNSGNPLSLYSQILSKTIDLPDMSDECRDLIKAALEKDPKNRPTFKELAKFPFFL